MDQKNFKNKILEATETSGEDEEQYLNEDMKENIKYLLGIFGKGSTKFLGSDQSKYRAVIRQLGNTEQLTKIFTNSKNPRTIAQLLQSMFLPLKLENPKEFDLEKILNSLRAEIKKDAKDIENIVAEKQKQQIEQEEAEKKGEKGKVQKQQEEKNKEPKLGGRGLMSAIGSEPTIPAETTRAARKPGEKKKITENLLSEMIFRKLMQKLVVK